MRRYPNRLTHAVSRRFRKWSLSALCDCAALCCINRMLAAPEPTSPRTVNGRRLSAASLQREHEYLDWLETRPQPEGDVSPPDDSMAVFMAERRAAKERARLQQVAERRREERWRQRYGHAPVHSSRHDARLPAGLQDVEAYVNERRAKADAAGRRCAPGICLRRDFPQARRKEKERLRLAQGHREAPTGPRGCTPGIRRATTRPAAEPCHSAEAA